MYYVEKENKIKLFDEDMEKLQNTLNFMPQYAGLEIQETERPIVDFEFADTAEWQAAQARKERERLDKLSLTPADVERALYTAKGMDFDDLIEFISQTYSPLEGTTSGEEPESLISNDHTMSPLEGTTSGEEAESLISNDHTMSPLDVTTSGEEAESLISNDHTMSPLDGTTQWRGTETSDFEGTPSMSPLDGGTGIFNSEGGDNTVTSLDIKALKIEFRAKDFYRGASLADGTRLFDVVGALLGYTPEDMDYLFENKTLPVKDEVIAPEESEIPEAQPDDNTEKDEQAQETEDTEEDTLEEKE